MKRRSNETDRDNRVNIKLSRSMCSMIEKEIEDHPEWGITSVTDFVRRAVDHELTVRRNSRNRKVLEVRMTNFVPFQENIPDKDP